MDISSLGTDAALSVAGGVIGSIIYLHRKHPGVVTYIAIMIIGGAMSELMAPFLVDKFGWQDLSGAHGFVGVLVGAFGNDFIEAVVALLDKIQNDPMIVINIIKSRLGSNEKKVQQKERDVEDAEGSEAES